MRIGETYYMYYEAYSTYATAVNRFFSFERGDSWVTSGAAIGDPAKSPDWNASYDAALSDTYPLGFAPFLVKAGTHPVYSGEVQYPRTGGGFKINRIVSLSPIQSRTEPDGTVWSALHDNRPVFWVYDSPAPGREALYGWFDVTNSNSFVTRDLNSDDPVAGLVRTGAINALPDDFNPIIPGNQNLLGYVASTLDGSDMMGSLQNRVMLATSTDGVHWTRFLGPARGGAVVAPQDELTSYQGFDLAAAREGGRPHNSPDPVEYYDIQREYGAGFPSALIRDGYLELYFSDAIPDGIPGTILAARRIRVLASDITNATAYAAARAPGQPSLSQFAGYGTDIKWSPLYSRYFVSFMQAGNRSLSCDDPLYWDTPAVIWSDKNPDPSLPPSFFPGSPDYDLGRLPTNYPDGTPGRWGNWGALLGDGSGHTVDFPNAAPPYAAMHVYYSAVNKVCVDGVGSQDNIFTSDIDHIFAYLPGRFAAVERSDFGSATANTSSTYITRQFTIQNTGSGTLNLGAVTLSPASGNWAITQQPAATVAPGGSTTFKIKFQPTTGGFLWAAVNIPNDDPNETPYDFVVKGYGIAPGARIERNNLLILDGSINPTVEDGSNFTAAGANVFSERVTREFTVNNTGSTALTLGSITVSTATPSAWAVTLQPATSLAPGASTTFRVRFQPTATGTFSGTVHLPTNDPVYGTYTFDIRGVGTDATYAAEIEIRRGAIVIVDGDSSPSSTDGTNFGSAQANNTAARITRQFTIYNLGVAPLVLKDPLRVAIDSASPANWKVTRLPDAVIQPGGSTTFNVRFQPTSAGLKSAMIRILNTDGIESPYDFAIQGLGTSAFAGALAEPVAYEIDAALTDDLAWLTLRAADELLTTRERKR